MVRKVQGFSKLSEGGSTDLLIVECCGNVVQELGGSGASQTARVQNAGVTGSGWSQGHGWLS